jgi:cytochrome c-type biogenesis protein CcmE
MKAKHIVALVVALVFIGVAALTLVDNKIDYSDFQNAQHTGKRAQISGTWVKEKGAHYDARANQFTFVMKDHKGIEMPVVFGGMKPNNFEMSPSVVCVGKIDGSTFAVTDIQTKCPSRYEGSGKMQTEQPQTAPPASSSM